MAMLLIITIKITKITRINVKINAYHFKLNFCTYKISMLNDE